MLKMELIGTLGKDSETRATKEGKTFIVFSVAHSYKVKGEKRVKWIDCRWFTDNLNIMNFLKKGCKVYIEGDPDAIHYTKGDNTVDSKLQLTVFKLELMSSPQQSDNSSNANGNTPAMDVPDDVPF